MSANGIDLDKVPPPTADCPLGSVPTLKFEQRELLLESLHHGLAVNFGGDLLTILVWVDVDKDTFHVIFQACQ